MNNRYSYNSQNIFDTPVFEDDNHIRYSTDDETVLKTAKENDNLYISINYQEVRTKNINSVLIKVFNKSREIFHDFDTDYLERVLFSSKTYIKKDIQKVLKILKSDIKDYKNNKDDFIAKYNVFNIFMRWQEDFENGRI